MLSNHKPWIPSPLLSMHVRMGDKACEMKVVEFEEYMQLADRIRRHFPNLNSIWLSTEMQVLQLYMLDFSAFLFIIILVNRFDLISGSHRQNQRIFWLELSLY